MKKILIASLLAVPLMASAAPNLIANGSFESGLTGWLVGSTPIAPSYLPTVITYGPTAAFGGPAPAETTSSLSHDAVGSRALYFVDDSAVQTVSQSFTVGVGLAGNYYAGASLFAPSNGWINPVDAGFSVKINGSNLVASTVGALASASWSAPFSTVFLGEGTHSFVISFSTLGGGNAKDLVLDRAFVTAVPEPGTYGMMALGLAMVGGMVRLRRRR